MLGVSRSPPYYFNCIPKCYLVQMASHLCRVQLERNYRGHPTKWHPSLTAGGLGLVSISDVLPFPFGLRSVKRHQKIISRYSRLLIRLCSTIVVRVNTVFTTNG
ncbi:hypothetical protein JTE90_011796 [Oedothorax gibbosus]|uniref:Uncharacterized protein n=1 Tax=Oedothorax gibbosus TaxID=931172 RepID=A0AAV6VS49_9ARAC|nr:hypothetical protein JTE90_011796 [Oedothorax gibbosus]